MTDTPLTIHKQAHIKYFKACLSCLPSHYVGLDTSRLTAILFAVTALDILNALDTIDKNQIIDYIYMMQICKLEGLDSISKFGFIGSPFTAHNICRPCNSGGFSTSLLPKCESVCDTQSSGECADRFHLGHIAMTFAAMASLLTLGDDLSRVRRDDILTGLQLLQTENGSFRGTLGDCESDMRFLYCACAISAMLGDWRGVDKDRAVQYVLSCLTYEGGISLIPGVEAHGGACYTGIASLVLMDKLDSLSDDQRTALLSWCERKQVHGFQGRTNRDPDSCYSFWIGASIQLLGAFADTDVEGNRDFLLSECQHSTLRGGFGKLPDTYPDILHSFYSLCWLSMAETDGLKKIDVRLQICADKSNLR